MSKENIPLVSICCITFNHEQFIAQALNGFLMQKTTFPIEIIVHDDASTDKTADIVRDYEAKHPDLFVCIYQTENQYSKEGGVWQKHVLPKARGKYIAFCEGDDYWTDSLKLQKQVSFLEENDDYVITYTSVEAFDENGIIENYIGGAIRDLDSIDLQKATPINTLTTCFRNVLTIYPYEYNYSKIGDLFVWALLADYGKGKYIENIKPARYRIHSGGIYSSIKQEEKLYMRFTLNSALFSYHHRMGNKEAEIYFKKLIFRSSILSFNPTFIIKEVIKIFSVKFLYKLYISTRINKLALYFKKL